MEIFLVISSLLFFSSWATVHADPPSYNPLPNPDSVMTVGQARFTVLTSCLIRMEWGQTVDSATLTFLNRYLPALPFKNYTEKGWTVIETDCLKVNNFIFHFLHNFGGWCKLLYNKPLTSVYI